VHPIIGHVGRFAIPSHELFVLLGTVAAAVVFFFETRRRELMDERLLWIVAGTLIAGAIGARFATVWRYVALSGDSSVEGMLLRGGRSILGGLAGAYVGAIATKKLVGYERKTGDLFAPAVALGMAIGRIGCFLSEQVGTPTTMPWGLRLDAATLARIPNCPYCIPGVALHPSFLYEIAFHLVMFVVLIVILMRAQRAEDLLLARARSVTQEQVLRPLRGHQDDKLFKIYLLAYAVFRFFVEFVRGNVAVWHGLSGSQLFLIPSTILLVAYFARQRWSNSNDSTGALRVRETST
jgi:phosphatidylglycerol---prolipoprotein diacylglyceryl transferase